MSEFAARQPSVAGLRNERTWLVDNWLDIFLARSREKFRRLYNRMVRADERIVRAVLRRCDELEALDEAGLEAALQEVRTDLRLQGITRPSIIEAFAVVREISGRTLGMRHHHTQIRLSLALLRGCVGEMATGEGKTLAATLASSTAALAGIPVHVVTVNDYLAERDAEEMMPLYHALGLTVGIITHEVELAERREAYASDICYCCNKELTFDFLKDRLVLDGRENPRVLQAALLTRDTAWAERLMLRGLHFAIVDEADSVLVDEARTPLIISGEEKFGQREEDLLKTAMAIASQFEKDTHFEQDETSAIHMTRRGQELLLSACKELEGIWRSSFYRDPLVKQALAALHVYHLDKDYIVDEEGALQIVDPYTGRVMPGRSWGQGLQQMIEMKEGIELTKPRETDAEISYQNFFRKYHHLCGMTGTGRELASELLDVYRLRSKDIPLLKASRRQRSLREVYATQQQKWARVAAVVSDLIEQGQAVLIGTNSVESSEKISEVLHQHQIAHKVLNARQDKEEAEIVADAGQPGAVMVATSMAGRGTDIKLAEATRAAGGLHVIITELQDSSRIDRQLEGRCARQGDPGMVSQILSLEDRLVQRMAGPLLLGTIKTISASGASVPRWLGWAIQQRCQQKIEALHHRQRMQLIKVDTQRQRTMAFAGDNL